MTDSLLSIFIAICIIKLPNAKETCSVEEALKSLDRAIYDEQVIRNYFHNNFGNDANCDCHPKNRPNNCADVLYSGFKKSGVYTIHFKPWLKTKPITVYCDMETDGGGWTVFQRRNDYPEKQLNFTKEWNDYAAGFGNVSEEFWLGNEYLHLLTAQDKVVLRIDLEDFGNNTRYATFETFEVDSKHHDFKMKVAEYMGSAGDSFSDMNGNTFVTFDRKNVNNCAKRYKGGWWYGNCHYSNLNGEYLRGTHENYAKGVSWYHWSGRHNSLKWTEMKIRPKSFKQ